MRIFIYLASLFWMALFLALPTDSFGQSQRNPCYGPSANSTSCIGVTTDTPLPVTGSISASLSGFHQESVLTPFTATTSGVTSGSFTAAKVIVVTNAGTTNMAYCQLGGSASTSSQPIAPNGGWFSFTSTVETTVTCATSTSTTTINVSVGTGLPTGTGGGGGSGGGAVTVADGADVTQGAIADAAVTAGGTGTLSAKLRYMTTQLDNINTNVQAAIPAGTNLIGDVNVRQGGTALSTTNGIYSNLLQGNAVLSATNPSFAAPIPATSGGLSVYFLQPTASTNSNNIKNAAGQVYKIDVFNNSATVHYIRLYNTATTGTCNSATNLVWQGIIPASTSGAGLSSSWDLGMAFSSGVALCVTSGYDGTGNATASALIVNVGYK